MAKKNYSNVCRSQLSISVSFIRQVAHHCILHAIPSNPEKGKKGELEKKMIALGSSKLIYDQHLISTRF